MDIDYKEKGIKMKKIINNCEKEGNEMTGKICLKTFLIIFSFSILIVLFMNLSFVSAAEPAVQNLSSKDQAIACLNESENIMVELADSNFSIERVNDTIIQAKALYNDIFTKKKEDYALVIDSCNEIKKIKELAYTSRDEFEGLTKFYNESITPGMNTTELDALMADIDKEISSERYEGVAGMIDTTYAKIIDVKSSYSTLSVLNRNLQNFFVRQWKSLVITFLVIVIPLIIFRVPILIAWDKNKINKLEVRKKTLRGLIKQTQKEYFEYGRLPEGMYNIKTKKFAELIRDIERQIPLLQEEIAKLERKKSLKLWKK